MLRMLKGNITIVNNGGLNVFLHSSIRINKVASDDRTIYLITNVHCCIYWQGISIETLEIYSTFVQKEI